MCVDSVLQVDRNVCRSPRCQVQAGSHQKLPATRYRLYVGSCQKSVVTEWPQCGCYPSHTTQPSDMLSSQSALELSGDLPDMSLPFESNHFEKRVMGICAIRGAVFLVRAHSYAIEEYSEAGVLTGTIAVPDSTSWLSGIAASTVHNCLYAAAHQSKPPHRVGLSYATHTVWYVPKWPAGVSVTQLRRYSSAV